MSERAGQPTSAVEAQPSAKTLRATRQKRRRLLAVGTVTAVLVASGGGVAYAMTRTEGGDYRTAAAALGSVSESLDLVGTLASASRSDASFSVAGTVSGVAVSLRDTVTVGQTLATLDVSSLNDAIDEAQANVLSAQVTLESDLDSQTATTATTDAAATSITSAASSTGLASGAISAVMTEAVKAVGAAQGALLAQYDVAVTALAATEDAIASTTDVCLPFLEAAFDEAAADTTTGVSTDTTTADTTTADTTTVGDTSTETAVPSTAAEQLAAVKLALADCQSAITIVLDGQSTTNEAQAGVVTLVDDLNESVAALQKASAAEGASSSSGASAASAAGTSAAAVAGVGATATVASAETILADQAEIGAAVAELAIAEYGLTLATLTSPIAGTVAAVDLAVGDTVTSSSSTAVITVIGEDGFVVSTTVSLTDIAGVAVGQSAAVTVASIDEELAGAVGSIGILNVSTSSTPSYSVQIALENADPALLNGASAAVTVAVASLEAVLTVPTSAVHLADSTYTVDVLTNGASTNTEVTVGAVGSELTEITTGIDAGDTVILADLNAAIASTDTETDSGLSGLGGDTSTDLRTPPAGMGGPPAG